MRIFPSEVDLQAESRGHELPELHMQVMCVQSFTWMAGSLEKRDTFPVYCFILIIGAVERALLV